MKIPYCVRVEILWKIGPMGGELIATVIRLEASERSYRSFLRKNENYQLILSEN